MQVFLSTLSYAFQATTYVHRLPTPTLNDGIHRFGIHLDCHCYRTSGYGTKQTHVVVNEKTGSLGIDCNSPSVCIRIDYLLFIPTWFQRVIK